MSFGKSTNKILMDRLAKKRGTTGTATVMNVKVGQFGSTTGSLVKSNPPTLGNVNRGLESSGALGSISGSSGAISRPASRPDTLGATYGDSGAISRPADRPSGLGAIYGDTGAISRPTDRPAGLGATYGDSGAISRPTDRPGGLGATYGDSGAISRPSDRPSGLGATYGDSGAISRPTDRPAGLGATYGNSGAISRPTDRPAGLGATYGDSGAISRPTNRPTGLGATYGSSGAVSRFGGNSGYQLGATSGSSGAIVRRSNVKSSLRGAPRKVGGVKRRKPFRTRAAVHRDTCCGEDITGYMRLEVHYEFDDHGNELPPKVVAWAAVLQGREWTPENWEDYLWMDNKLGSIDETLSATAQTQTSAVAVAKCAKTSMDFPDPHGRRVGSTSHRTNLGQHHKILPPIQGRGLVPVRFLLWPG